MAKRSQRRPARSEKDQSAGCMWGLISIFDFRQGRSTQKLLSDKRHGSSRHTAGAKYPRSRLNSLNDFDEKCQGIDDGDESITQKVDNGKTSVKKLMEEEISCEKHPKKQITSAAEQMQSDSGRGGKFGKNHKQTNKTCKVACDIHAHDPKASTSLESQESYHPNSVEESLHNLDLAAVMEEFCSQIHQFQDKHLHHENGEDSCYVQKSISSVKHNQLDELNMQLVQKHSTIQEKLSEAAEVFLNQKFIDAKQLTGDGAFYQSQKFMDTLEILNSNKELFLNLLEDPNSLLVKHIQDLLDAQALKVKPTKLGRVKSSAEEIDNSRQHEELVIRKQFQKQNMHNFFRRKVKSQGRNPSKGSDSPQVSNGLVVLKPNQVGIQNSATAPSPSSSSHSQYSLRNQGQSRTVNSHFSFTEIKRKLKQAMGESRKEQHLISRDAIVHRIPCECKDSWNVDKVISGKVVGRDLPSKTYVNVERTAKPPRCNKRRDKIGKHTDCQPNTGNEIASTSADSNENLTMTTVWYPMQRESNIYTEAKKHLAEMLSTRDEDEDLSSRQVSRTLGRVLSLPEYNLSPIFTPGRDREHSFSTVQMRFSPYDNFQIVNENMRQLKQENNSNRLNPSRQNLETTLCTSGNSPDVKLQVLDSNLDTSKELLPDEKMQDCITARDFSPKGGVEIIEITDIACSEENNLLDVPSEPIISTPITSSNQSIDTTKNCQEEGSFEYSRLDSSKENQPSSSSLCSGLSSFLPIQKVSALDDGPERPSPVSVLEPFLLEDVISPAGTISQPAVPSSSSLCSDSSSSILILKVNALDDGPERPSPVSVLEPFLLEDVISPVGTISQPAEPPLQPLKIHFEEHDSSTLVSTSDLEIYLRTCMEDKKPTFEYVRAVLQASGLNWDEFFGKCHSSDQPLDLSLFDEIEDLTGQLCGNRKLLFDCINEVLMEVYERYSGCSPWVSFVKPHIRPVPIGSNIIREVWEDIDWHILPQLPPLTLDQIIGKDMAKAATWMDLRFNTEALVIEMEEIILEELMDDTIIELCT